MTTDQAQTAVSISALVVAGVYGYRKLTEAATSSSSVPPVAHFVIGFGFVYIVLSAVAEAAPELGGMGAILVATGDALINGTALVTDLTGALNNTRSATSTATGTNTSATLTASQQQILANQTAELAQSLNGTPSTAGTGHQNLQ